MYACFQPTAIIVIILVSLTLYYVFGHLLKLKTNMYRNIFFFGKNHEVICIVIHIIPITHIRNASIIHIPLIECAVLYVGAKCNGNISHVSFSTDRSMKFHWFRFGNTTNKYRICVFLREIH